MSSISKINLSDTDYTLNASSISDYNSSTAKIQVGFAGAGLTASTLGYVAGYTTDGTKIKDVNKAQMKSWLGLGSAAYVNLNTVFNRHLYPALGSTQTGNTPVWLLGLKGAGYPVYSDPEFASGTTVEKYANSGSENLTVTRGLATDFGIIDSGNSSGYVIQIKNTGTVVPGLGGFYLNPFSRANAIFIQIFRAMIPSGYSVQVASNPMGTSYQDTWLTSNAGTGKWEWYVRSIHCGSTGSFSSGGHVYLTGTTGTTDNPVIWYLSYCNCIDITKGNYDGLRTRFSDKLSTARNLKIGNTSKSFDGSSDVSWSLSEIGCLPKSGGTMSGDITFPYGTGIKIATGTSWDDGFRSIPFSNVSDPSKIQWYSTNATTGLTFNAKSGTLKTGELITSGSTTSSKFIKSGGTSSQFLKADGSVDSNSYSTTSHTHTKSQITDFPASLKNPTSLTVKLNSGTTEGTNLFTYDGSAAKTVNITPSAIGAATSGHTHSTYFPYSGGTFAGPISFNTSSLPKFSGAPPFIVGIEAFADGGTLKWADADAVKVGTATTSSYSSYLGNSSTNYSYSTLKSALDGKSSTSHTHNYATTVKIGTDTTSYTVSSNTITLPAYPTASSLGLSSAMKFIGTTTTALTDGATTNPITISSTSVTATSGNVVLYGNKEFLWNSSTGKWEELGDESSHALKTVSIKAGTGLSGGGTLEADRTLSLNTAGTNTLGGVKTTSTVTSNSGYTACPIIGGIPYYKDTNTVYSLPTASSSTLGGIKTGYTTSGKNYKVQLDSSNNAYVNVPWTNSTYNFIGSTFYSYNSNNKQDCDNCTTNGVYYYISNGPSGITAGDGALYTQAYSTSWVGQIAQDYRSGHLFLRGKNNGKWTDWLTNCDSSNTYISSGTVYINGNSIKPVTSETSLSKGTTSGSGNAVTDISVSGHKITLTKDTTFLTAHQDISGKADKASITAGTAGTSSATSGSSLSVPYVTVNTQGIVTGYGTHKHTISGFAASSHTHSYLPLSGGTMTGKIYRNYASASAVPFIHIGANDVDATMLRVYSSDGTETSNYNSLYGYSLIYRGSGSGINNRLDLMADNQTSTQVTAISVNNQGDVGIKTTPTQNVPLTVNGSISATRLTRTGNGSFWYAGRTSALVRTTSVASDGWNVITSLKTKNGDWSTGVLGSTDKLEFCYTTDTDFNAGPDTNITMHALSLDNTGNLTTNGSTTSSKFIKSGGTSSQFLKADGSVDSNSYSTTSHTHTKSQITNFPASLKNPTSLTVKLNSGTTEGTNLFTYDGSAAKTVNITPSAIGAATSGHTHGYVSTVKVGSTSYTVSSNTITLPAYPTAASLGLSSAMKFIGTTTTALTDGATTNTITIGSTSVTATSGNVVLYGNKEFLWNGSTSKWEELGDESSHALKTVSIKAGTGLSGGGTLEADRTLSLNTAGTNTLGGVKTTSTVTSNSGYTACPIIGGIPYYKDTNTVYSLPIASSSTLGGIKTGYTTSGKNYKVQLDSNNNAYVNVPWTDTYTQYPYGFSSRLISSWGNQIGTIITDWHTASGGDVQWMNDNPVSGQVSLKVDGTVYINEGNDAVASQTWVNNKGYLTAHQDISGKSNTSHTHSVKINGTTKTIAASGGTAVDLGTYLTAHQDISGKQDKSTAVTHTASTAVGGSTQPVYIASDGTATAIGYTIAKSVPSNAVFTDTNQTVKGNGTGFGSTAAIDIVGSGATTVTADTTNNKITISSTNTTYTAGTNVTISGTTISAKDTVYSLPTASSSTLGGIKIGSNLSIDSNGVLSGTANTTYSAGTGISLSGTTFSNSGVRSISTGTTNGTILVNTGGTTGNVAVKGLGSAAYTASSAYATASHTHSYLPLSGGGMTGSIHSRFTSNTWVNSLTDSVITLDHTGYSGWICGPTKSGRIAISTYPGSDQNDNNLYFGYGETGRTENSFASQMWWDGANNVLYAGTFKRLSGAEVSYDGHTHPQYLTSIPIASSSKLGGIKVGSNLSISSDGTLSGTADTHYRSANVVTNSATGATNTSTALTNGNVYLNHFENGTSILMSSHKISGTGATTVTTDTKGNILINSTDTNTHYASSTIVSNAATGTANASTSISNGKVYLNHIENGAVKSSHLIKGSGATTVTANSSNQIIISSTNTTYSANGLNKLSGTTMYGNGVVPAIFMSSFTGTNVCLCEHLYSMITNGVIEASYGDTLCTDLYLYMAAASDNGGTNAIKNISASSSDALANRLYAITNRLNSLYGNGAIRPRTFTIHFYLYSASTNTQRIPVLIGCNDESDSITASNVKIFTGITEWLPGYYQIKFMYSDSRTAYFVNTKGSLESGGCLGAESPSRLWQIHISRFM